VTPPDGPHHEDPTSAAIEAWFVGRGVPHLIADYSARHDIWTRALPILALAYLVGGFNALDLHRWSPLRNLAVGAGVVAALTVVWIATNVAYRRPLLARPTVVGKAELAMFVVGPSLPSLAVAQWGDALQTVVEGLAVLAVVYVGTSYAVVPIMLWAVRRTWAMGGSLGRMIARALPLLLLFITFLFINAEVWQVAATLTGVPYVLLLVVFFVLGGFFVVSRVPSTITDIARFDDWAEVRDAVRDTPAEVIPLPEDGDPVEHPLSVRERINVGLVSLFGLGVQVTLVAVVITLFFTLFGFLAIPTSTQLTWTGLDDVAVLASVTVSGNELVLTDALLRVAGFLGAFTGMYFTVTLVTDDTYRSEFSEDVRPQLRQAFAVQVAYLHARARGTTLGG